ncbi:hypothetical protein D3C81_1717230 [compost metagenome]
MNTNPVEVVIGPPRVGIPIGIGKWVAIPNGPVCSVVPKGIDQAILRVARSMAVRVP